MLPEQKRAWFAVAVFAVAFVCYVLLTFLVGPKPAFAASGLLGLWGLTPVLFRKKRDPAEVAFDERDTMILKKATLVGAIISYEVFYMASFVPWGVYYWQGKETISIHVLPLIAFSGGIVLMVARAIGILILYGREGGHAEG